MKPTVTTRVPSVAHVRSLEKRIAALEKALAAMRKQAVTDKADFLSLVSAVEELQDLPYARPPSR